MGGLEVLAASRFGKIVRVLLLPGLLVTAPYSHAEVTGIKANASGVLGHYSDANYLWVTAEMQGTVNREDGSSGKYRVPITLIYPDDAVDSVGLVDVINNAQFESMHDGEPPTHQRTAIPYAEKTLGDYLWRNRYSYIAVQWAKMTTQELGLEYGEIERGRDGYHILSDASVVLRNPVKIIGELAFQPQPVKQVLGFGFSQTAGIVRSYIAGGHNRSGDTLYYDGMLAVASAGGDECQALTDQEVIPTQPAVPKVPSFIEWIDCPNELPHDGKYVALMTESEVDSTIYWGWRDRVENEFYRQYEIAGVAHLPPILKDLRRVGKHHQNPVSINPVIRASLDILAKWVVDNLEPPLPQYIEGSFEGNYPDGSFKYTRDANGNVLGGVRLPHMTRILADGTKAGAPLGIYTGLDPDLPPWEELTEQDSNYWYWMRKISGTFAPFAEQKIRTLYPNQKTYVELVKKAADIVLEERFILLEDHRSYVAEAELWSANLFK